MHFYTQLVVNQLSPHASTALAEPMRNYMRNQFPFLGIRTPERRALMRTLLKAQGMPPTPDMVQFVRELWSLPEREYAYAAMQLVTKCTPKAGPDHIQLIEELITTKSWWDTVDLLAGTDVGAQFKKFPELIPTYTEQWVNSGNMWLQRSVLLFQLKYKQNTDTELLFTRIRELADHKDFFIRKAIGWALREYSKTDAAAVITFIEEEKLSPLSVTEGLKVIRRTTSR
ncbi:DNA alkylation repair protein [Paenibacillus swuensis]|uniref:DNA alkylation repair protein n=1 Tax=Paenibacillus swuensis TaxID=1178515 RepID=A0A172TDN7_9BACL|nr:DNA alkylation repair protein [Paenibacillus swuensis]ANE45155.1 DNA alkylation repair protein [Paenibacillus swuensis]